MFPKLQLVSRVHAFDSTNLQKWQAAQSILSEREDWAETASYMHLYKMFQGVKTYVGPCIGDDIYKDYNTYHLEKASTENPEDILKLVMKMVTLAGENTSPPRPKKRICRICVGRI